MKHGGLAKSPAALGTVKVRWCQAVSGSHRQPVPPSGELAASPPNRRRGERNPRPPPLF
jgi:hypothetical protein